MGLTLLQEDLAQTIREMSSGSRQITERNSKIDSGLLQNLEEWSLLAKDVHESARSSVSILDDLLNFDKVESGTLSLEVTMFPLLGLVRDTYREFRLSAQNKKIKFGLEFRPSPLLPEDVPLWERRNFAGDSIRITQVIRNLISNAIKFTPEGGE